MSFDDHLLYALMWVGFGLPHSLLARSSVKARLRPWFGRSYRLSYNIFALSHLGLVFAVGWLVVAPSSAPFVWPATVEVARYVVLGVGVVVLLAAARSYDGPRFLGLRQLSEAGAGGRPADPDDRDEEPLRVTGPHRYVRHPLYLGVLLILWGNVSDPFSLATAAWGSLYLFIGTWFEERTLIARFGAAYREYRAVVPAILPVKGRAWTSN